MCALPPYRSPYNAYSYADLEEARSGFLNDPGDPNYNTWLEPNLPWGQQIPMAYLAGQIEMAWSLVADASWMATAINRWVP